MGQYLIDNNCISHYFSGLFSKKGMEFMADVLDQTPIISVVTEIEALSWINSDKRKEGAVRAFVEDAIILALTPAVVAQCVRIRRSHNIKTPDAILAATAIEHNLTLLTNDNDFATIADLQVIDPRSL